MGRRLKQTLKEWLADLAAMIFPQLCEVCGNTLRHGEKVMCLRCRMALPRTHLHHEQFSHIHRRLAGKAPVDKAAGYFYYYRGNDYTRLIHVAKYNNRPQVAFTLASDFATELMPENFFDGIDMIIPVPLHISKRRRRGYNQSEFIARGLSSVTGITVADHLKATRDHSTQTKLNAYRRWLNARNIYAVERPEELDGKHILVVDDVLTTGATLLACCEAIHTAAPAARISVLTLAVAHLQ